jgi:hypothetical protein
MVGFATVLPMRNLSTLQGSLLAFRPMSRSDAAETLEEGHRQRGD